MKKCKVAIILGVVASVVGLVMTIFNSIETYSVINGIWNPVKENGETMGAWLYIAFLCVGAVLLIGGIVCIVLGAKKNKE